MKLNLGSGVNKRAGYINIDKFDYGNPDMVMDLEVTPWGFKDNEVGEVVLNHTLEHLGKDVNVFFSIIKELYRVCRNDAKIEINVPHPRHDNFLNDPTHVRIITPELLGLFSKKNCQKWQDMGAANSPLAFYLDVDFELISSSITLEKKYLDQLVENKITKEQLGEMLHLQNNVAAEYRILIKPIKNIEKTIAINC